MVGFAAARNVELLPSVLDRERYDGGRPLEPQQVVEGFARSGVGSIVVTDDGSLGVGGHAVDAVTKFLEANPEWREAQVYACGPHAMLKGVADLARERQMACQVCLEAYMGCGIGVCQACVVAGRSAKDGGEGRQYRLVCTEGPVFEAESIIWD